MDFKWLCACGHENFYNGKKTKTANSDCSKCKKNQKIWSKKIIEVPTTPDQIRPKKSEVPTIEIIREDLYLGVDYDRTVLIAGLMDTIKIYKNKFLGRDGKILGTVHKEEGKKVLEWVEMYDNQKAVPMLVVHQAYFQKVDLAYKELKKLRL